MFFANYKCQAFVILPGTWFNGTNMENQATITNKMDGK